MWNPISANCKWDIIIIIARLESDSAHEQSSLEGSSLGTSQFNSSGKHLPSERINISWRGAFNEFIIFVAPFQGLI